MNTNEFFNKLHQSDQPVVVDFWAPWCGPCKMIEPLLAQVEREYQGRVNVWKINADEHPEVLRGLKIYGIPTIVGFTAGEEISRQTGITSKQNLEALFETAISGERPASPPLGIVERMIRMAIGLVLLLLAYSQRFEGVYLIVAFLSGIAFFSAVYDRCPVWQAIAPRFKALFRGQS